MRIYEKPSMTVTCYNAMDTINLTLNTSVAIAPYNKGSEGINSQSFVLHGLKS